MVGKVFVACVLDENPGVTYSPIWVERLRSAVSANMTFEHEFVCFTNTHKSQLSNVDCVIPFSKRMSGWWSKIALFGEDVPWDPQDYILYIDIDSIITGPLDHLVRFKEGFTMVRDFFYPDNMNSSVMSWRGDFSEIASNWSSDVRLKYDAQRPGGRIGDQAYIEDVLTATIGKPNPFPTGTVGSFKKNADRNGYHPSSLSIITFHGKPKMDQVEFNWVKTAWCGQ